MTLTRTEGENLFSILSQVGEDVPSEFIDGLTRGNAVDEIIEALHELISQIRISEKDLIIDSLSCACGGKLEIVGDTAAGWTYILCCKSEGCDRIYHIDHVGEEMRLDRNTFREFIV